MRRLIPFVCSASLILAACGKSRTPVPVATPPDDNPARIEPPPPRQPVSQPVEAPRAGQGPEEQAPGGVLLDENGQKVDLTKLYTNTAAVIVFYRGFWCVQCKKQLVELEAEYKDMLHAGLHVYAISVDPPEENKKLRAKLKLSYPLLSDVGGKVARAWHVLDESTTIAKPASIVVKAGGAIHYRYVGKDPNDRPHSTDLRKLGAAAVPATP